MRSSIMLIAGIVVSLSLQIGAANAEIWTAFNDLAGDNSTGNVTNIRGVTGTGTSGTLVNYADGSSTGVSLAATYASGGGYTEWNWDIDTAPTAGDGYAYFVPGGTPAVNFMGATDTSNGLITLEFTNLDPSGRYAFTLWANRNGSSANGSRWNGAVISGMDSFVNSSSEGAYIGTDVVENDTGAVDIMANTVPGVVARFTAIAPGADGAFMVELYASGGEYLEVSAIRLDMESVVPEPGSMILLSTALMGLLCYAWRKRK